MRKIIAGLFVSLDGVVEAPENWTFDYFNDDIQEYINAGLAMSDVLLLGRMTYNIFADSWPSRTGFLADMLNQMHKVVVSTTLKSADWNNSTLVSADVMEEIAKIKQLPGKDISTSGSTTLVRWLMAYGLLDELSLLVFPLVLGSGQLLFPARRVNIPLKLIEAKSYSTGVVLLRYQPVEK